jgi:hypothetical protein
MDLALPRHPDRGADERRNLLNFYSLEKNNQSTIVNTTGNLGTPYNGTKLRGIVVKKSACLPAKSAIFPIKRHLAQPLRRSNMLNLVPLGTPYIFLLGFCYFYFRISSDFVGEKKSLPRSTRRFTKPLTFTICDCRFSIVVDYFRFLRG